MLQRFFGVRKEAFLRAARDGGSKNLAIVQNYVSANTANSAAINVTNENGETALILAARIGDIAIVKALLSASSINVNAIGLFDCTALIRAVRGGHCAVAQALLAVPTIDVNIADEIGDTPLSWAAYRGNMPIIQILVDRQANIAHQNNEGKTAEEEALQKGFTKISAFLAARRAVEEKTIHLSVLRHVPTFQERLDKINYKDKIPAEYCCPISKYIMNDPLSVSSGITYERESLTQYFAATGTSTVKCTVTNIVIRKEELNNRTHVLAKNKIEEFVELQEKRAKENIRKALTSSPKLKFFAKFDESESKLELELEKKPCPPRMFLQGNQGLTS